MKEKTLLTFSSIVYFSIKTKVKLYKSYELTISPQRTDASNYYNFHIENIIGDFEIQGIKCNNSSLSFDKETMMILGVYDCRGLTRFEFSILTNVEFKNVQSLEYKLYILNIRFLYLKEFDYYEDTLTLINGLAFKYLVKKLQDDNVEVVIKNPIKIKINGKNEDYVYHTNNSDINLPISFITESETIDEEHSQPVENHELCKIDKVNSICMTDEVMNTKQYHITEYNVVYDFDQGIDVVTIINAEIGLQNSRARTVSLSSDESFNSADDHLTTSSPAELKPSDIYDDFSNHDFYEEAIAEVQLGNVKVRKLRTKLCSCKTDEEFLAKVYCLRQAFDKIFENESTKEWLVQQGREIFADLLRQNQTDPKDFYVAYDKLMDYLSNSSNYEKTKKELEFRNIHAINAWDVLFDSLLLNWLDIPADAFWPFRTFPFNFLFSRAIQETILSYSIWSVVQFQRRTLPEKDGFRSHILDISQILSPVLVYGSVGGASKEFHEICLFFKKTIHDFVTDIFYFEEVRYSTVDALADDVQSLLQYHMQKLRIKLSTGLTNI